MAPLLFFRQMVGRQNMFVCAVCFQNSTQNSSHNIPSSAVVAEFAQINSLPGAKIKLVVGDRNGDRRTNNCSLDVSRHIVSALGVMSVVGVALWNQLVEDIFEVGAHRRVSIFVDCKRRRCVLNHQVQKPALWQFWHILDNGAGYQVVAALIVGQCDLKLCYHSILYCQIPFLKTNVKISKYCFASNKNRTFKFIFAVSISIW